MTPILALQILTKNTNSLVSIPITVQILEQCKSFLDIDGKYEDEKLTIWVTGSMQWDSEEEYQEWKQSQPQSK